MFAALILMVGIAGPATPKAASDRITADEVIGYYDQGGQGRAAAFLMANYASEGIMMAEAYDETRGVPKLICPPPALPVNGDLIISIMRSQIKNDADIGKLPFTTAVFEGMVATFPCHTD